MTEDNRPREFPPSPLRPEQYTAVLIHYELATEKMLRIARGEERNFEVNSPDFLEPSTKYGKSVPLSQPTGEFLYYWGIKTALEYALVKGKIPAKLMPQRAPTEIMELKDPDTTGICDLVIG
jgi:hypothetical protein